MGEVRVEQRGRVLLATLDNPPHGLMDAGIVDGLETVVWRADSDDAVGAVVLTGAHPLRFVAHYDVRELLENARSGPTGPLRTAAGSLRARGVRRRGPAAQEVLGSRPC